MLRQILALNIIPRILKTLAAWGIGEGPFFNVARARAIQPTRRGGQSG